MGFKIWNFCVATFRTPVQYNRTYVGKRLSIPKNKPTRQVQVTMYNLLCLRDWRGGGLEMQTLMSPLPKLPLLPKRRRTGSPRIINWEPAINNYMPINSGCPVVWTVRDENEGLFFGLSFFSSCCGRPLHCAVHGWGLPIKLSNQDGILYLFVEDAVGLVWNLNNRGR